MKPINFKHANIDFAKNQDEYQTLPGLKIKGPEGHVISCWKPSFLERLKILFIGKIWLDLMCFNQPLTPSYLTANRKEVYTHPDDDITLKSKAINLLNKIPLLIRGLEVKLRYVFWALSKIFKISLGDIVIYNGVECIIVNGVNNPYWHIKPLDGENAKMNSVHQENFKPVLNLKVLLSRFLSKYQFQKRSWYSIDKTKPLFSRIAYKSSSNIKFA
mgnify:FL=1